jgi:ABC-2 type transport system permease protein
MTTIPFSPVDVSSAGTDPRGRHDDQVTLPSSVMTMARVGWRTHRAAFVTWTAATVGILFVTALSVAGLYDTPQKIADYAAAVAGGSLYAINGKVEGINSLGGVIQDEFGFVSSLLCPLVGIALVARLTRGEEESGRLELLGSRSVHRRSVPLAAMAATSMALVAAAIGMSLSMIVAGVPPARGIVYALSLSALSFVFAGVAVLAAQLVLHSRGVYMIGFGVLLVAYLLRGVGDVSDNWLVWLSPLGWQEKVAAFGPVRVWALLLPLAVGSMLTVLAAHLAEGRDVGSSIWSGGAGPAHAGPTLRKPFGTAAWLQRSSIIGWTIGAVTFTAMFGALAKETISAIRDNPSLADALGAHGHPEDGFLAMTLLYIAILASVFVAQVIATLNREDRAGHVEAVLAGPIDRTRWLAANMAVVVAGLITVVAASTVVFGLVAAASLGDPGRIGELLTAGFAYLPAELLVGAIALAAFGAAPRLYGLVWLVVAGSSAIAFLGPGLALNRWILDLAPTTHVGFPPDGNVDATGIVVMLVLAAVFTIVGFVGFRRRGVPQR